MAETSVLTVKAFPRALRQQLHSLRALEDRPLHEVVADVIARGLAAKAEAKKKGKTP